MLYFSRLILNERNPEVRRDIADCNRLHSRILRAFPQVEQKGNVREQFGVLYRLESPDENSSGWCLLAQSVHNPDWSTLPVTYAQRQPDLKQIDEIYDRITSGMVFRFRLRANPTKRVGRKDDERWQGRRVALRREEEQIEWLQRKGEQNGFMLVPVHSNGKVVDVRGVFEPDAKGRRRSANQEASAGGRLTFGSTLFEGFLSVNDAAQFRLALEHGIGSGKAFGFGLLSIAPARRIAGQA